LSHPEDSSFAIVPLQRTLFVEGESRERDIRRFRGVVLALGYRSQDAPAGRFRRDEGPPQVWYLVSDRLRPAPFWVDASQLTRQDWVAPEALVEPPTAPVPVPVPVPESASVEALHVRG
jgi:hypothetical protein